MQPSPLLCIISDESSRELANQLSTLMGYTESTIVVGTPPDAMAMMNNMELPPKYLLVEIGSRVFEVLPELDQLAEHCSMETKVVVVGSTNDITFYRELIKRGVTEYFPHPADVTEIRKTLVAVNADDTAANSKVFTFMSAASGDGSSTVALNTAYCLANNYNKSTVIIDMDFQFGMIARNLDLSTQYGIKELFEHPDRSIDSTLLNRMLVKYGDNLQIVAAPNDLRLWPNIPPDLIRDLINTLRQRFDCVIIDLPHVWSSWLATALSISDKNVIIAQLWLRSVTHTARLLGAWNEIGIPDNSIFTIINRSGAKFKEAVTARDYENVCRRKINYFIGNDIKAIVSAENEGKTIPEVGNSLLAKQFNELAGTLIGVQQDSGQDFNETSTKSGVSSLSGLFSKK